MRIYPHISLQKYNTFHIDCQCQNLIVAESDNDIIQLFKNQIFKNKYYIIGGGSNLLFTSPFEGTIIQLKTSGITVLQEDNDFVWLRVAAGVQWEDFTKYCIQKKYYGVENLVGIPGLVGSCPVQNIGAYSVEVKDVIESVEGYRISTQQPFILKNVSCKFSYRSSIFKTEWKNDTIITYVIFKLSKKEHYTITYEGLKNALKNQSGDISLDIVANTIIHIRNQKLPDLNQIGCAGSFFKNPIILKEQLQTLLKQYPQLIHYPQNEETYKLAAGQLIDLAGLKGYREGDVGVYSKQALVIVNYGKATGKEVVAFYQKVQQKVKEQFDILIEPEVNIL